MLKGFTAHIDLAQIMLYMFWAFFAGLIYYLHRENKREGYPLVTDNGRRGIVQGFPAIPPPRTYLLPDGTTQTAPRAEKDERVLKASPSAPWAGSPLAPTGDGMVDGVGPAAWTERLDVPDKTAVGTNRILPLRIAMEFHIDERDPDPRGMTVYGADGQAGGKVTDVWVDLSESLIRYLEVELAESAGNVLLPINFTRFDKSRNLIDVAAICTEHFARVPRLRSPNEITRREEDRICGYYGGGTLYATPQRSEPLL